ncbi:hypothetical protein [Mesorhizobium sp.]|uniref:hypothetical protein n=1 Tax=Mesorhizobium sp. TaxID=1871066 RepID=UPI0025D4D4D8|nr:hypothetical protein [Mesorhizobium sp.]
MALVSCCPGAACFALPVCCPGAQSFAEFGLVEFVVVESVPWLLGIVVVVDDELDELPDWAAARPLDRASKAIASNIRFIAIDPVSQRPFIRKTPRGQQGSDRIWRTKAARPVG